MLRKNLRQISILIRSERGNNQKQEMMLPMIASIGIAGSCLWVQQPDWALWTISFFVSYP